jgi:hypothetical protein
MTHASGVAAQELKDCTCQIIFEMGNCPDNELIQKIKAKEWKQSLQAVYKEF